MEIKSIKKHNRYNKKRTKKEKSVKTLNDKQKVSINFIENKRDKAIINFLSNTGLRVSELIDLNYDDLFSDIRDREINEVIYVIGKGNKRREIPLNESAINSIKEIDKYNRQVLKIRNINRNIPFLISRIGTRMSRQAIYNITKNTLKVSPHVLRHTFGSELAKSNERIEVISSILGHSSIEITNRFYIAKTLEDKVNAVKALDKKNSHNVALKLVK